MDYNNASFVERYAGNPILTGKDFPEEYRIAHCFNSGVTKYNGKYLMLNRLEDCALKAYFWIADSDDGFNFTPRAKPIQMPTDNPAFQKYASINYYDPRITRIDDVYYIMHACHSEYDCRLSLMKTVDFEEFEWLGFVSDPGNRNGILFPEKINGLYARLDRPLTSWEGGNIWMSFSPDLIHWGQSECVLKNSAVRWAWSKVGGGCTPIKTGQGWLNLFHGVRTQCKAHYVYQSGVCLHDLNDPTKVIAVSEMPILTPMKDYELHGQTPSVCFITGAVVEDSGEVKVYYGGADTVMCAGTIQLDTLIDLCFNRLGISGHSA